MASDIKKKEASVKLIFHDTFFASVSNGIKQNFIIPFAIALKAGNEQIALISAAPQLMGSFFQLFAADLMNVIKKRKKVIVLSTAIDALLWIPILLTPIFWESNYMLLLNFLILQMIASSFLNPFYNSLIGDVIAKEKRGATIGTVNKITSIITFFSSLAAGLILAVFKAKSYLGFMIIFAISFLARSVSALIRSRLYEPRAEISRKSDSFMNFSRSMHKTNFGKFVIYASLMKFAVGIASPFFAVYMLTYLKLDFITFSLINAATIISSFIVLDKWGEDIDRNGSRWMLGITGFLVPVVPVLWIFFKRPIILFIIELFSGAVWAGYNLSTSNFVMDATDSKNRLIMTSYYNFFIGVMTFIGAVIGGKLISNLPLDFSGNVFLFIFGISAVLRLIFSLVFIPLLKEERFVDIEIRGPREKRIISVVPKEGVIHNYVPGGNTHSRK
ncbi:MFS transporter [Candidatus Woesearchaeota archaeon]|nr:MFS transporter [Candidatus Woesearchaeota archaeon]